MSGNDFWARRKAAVLAEEQTAKRALEQQALHQEQAALEEKSDADILAELDLPDPDQLQMGDDFSAFMAKAVPDRIRRRALRTLWRSNPVLANVDMLVDYGEDFTDSALVVENMQTAYQVGKGMLKHIEEMARQAEEQETPPQVQEHEPDDAPASQDDPDLSDAPVAAQAASTTIAPVDASMEDADDIHPEATPRRMKFSILKEGVA